MRHLSKPCKQYLKQAKNVVPDSLSNRNEILKLLKTSLINYTTEHPKHSYNDLIEEFGVPEDIAVLDLSDSELQKARKIRKYNRIIILALIIFLIAFISFMTALFIKDSQSTAVRGEISIEDLGPDSE